MNSFYALAQTDFKLLAQWKQLDFVFPNEQVRQMAIRKKQFVMGNAVPLDTEVHYRGNNWFDTNNYYNFYNWPFRGVGYLHNCCQDENFHLTIPFLLKLLFIRLIL